MIIGLSGYARCGKDTVAQVLIDNYVFERVAFADPIREILLELDPTLEKGTSLRSMVEDYGWEVAKALPEVRRLLQVLGVSARNILGQTIWVDTAVTKLSSSDKRYVITDVRFENEAEAIKRLGGEVWRVERPGVEAVNNHVSESSLGSWEFDKYIHNGGTLEDLEFLIKMEMQSVL